MTSVKEWQKAFRTGFLTSQSGKNQAMMENANIYHFSKLMQITKRIPYPAISCEGNIYGSHLASLEKTH